MSPPRAPAVLDTFKRQIDAPWLAEYIEVAARYGHTIQLIETLPLDGQSFRPKLSIDTRGGSSAPVSRETLVS